MSTPVEYDFALIKYSDGAVIPVFATLCGVKDVTFNRTAETSARRVRDCDKPNKPGTQKVKILGTSYTVSTSGLTNAAIEIAVNANLFAKKVNYRIEYYADDGTDGGDLLGTRACYMIMNAENKSIAVEGESSQEYTFEGEGEPIYTAAP